MKRLHLPKLGLGQSIGVSLTLSILTLGCVLLVRTLSLPAYEAVAEVVVEEFRPWGFFDDTLDEPTNELVVRERGVFESFEVAQLASTLLADMLDSFPDCAPCDLDVSFVQDNRSVTIRRGSNRIEVRFTADDPALAQAGANAIVDAYRQTRSQDDTVGFGVEFGIPSASLAEVPTQRQDVPSAMLVGGVLLAAAIPALVMWRRASEMASSPY